MIAAPREQREERDRGGHGQRESELATPGRQPHQGNQLEAVVDRLGGGEPADRQDEQPPQRPRAR